MVSRKATEQSLTEVELLFAKSRTRVSNKGE